MKDTNVKISLIIIGVLSAVLWLSPEAEAGVIRKPINNLGLVGYWSMNEGSGLYAGDSSGNVNSGTLTNGPVWTSGRLGRQRIHRLEELSQPKNRPDIALHLEDIPQEILLSPTAGIQHTLR